MLKQRVITSLIALPIALGLLIFAPQTVILAVFALFTALGAWESAMMLAPKFEGILSSGRVNSEPAQSYPKWIVGLSIVFAVLVFVASAHDSPQAGRGMVLVGALGSMLIGCFCSPNNNLAIGRICILLISITYGAFPWLAAWDLYIMFDASAGLIFLIAVVFSGDTGAYFGGRRFGRRKLAPRMSPNKTREGALCGLFASVVAGILVNLGYDGSLGSWGTTIVAAALGGVFGQMGDLVESSLKRFSGVKDSGFVFPGHGGFLDRVDGILFAAPVIWFVLYLAPF